MNAATYVIMDECTINADSCLILKVRGTFMKQVDVSIVHLTLLQYIQPCFSGFHE